MSSSYQLTAHPVGTKREFWALTWPLMIGLVSGTLMFFADRLFLAQYNPLALNASASGGMAYWMFLVIPMGIAAIAEVLAGRLHGEGRFREVGCASLQMVWFSVFLAPLFWLLAIFAPPLLFAGTGNEVLEGRYFSMLTYFAPAHCIIIALSGFFIGIGKVKFVTYAALLGNATNIFLDYALIFGWGPFPEMGITGAALATGIAQFVQAAVLGLVFWNGKNRAQFGTGNVAFQKDFFLEGIKIGAPAGFGRCAEVFAHFLFLRIVISRGADQMAVVSMVQSLYILFSFVTEAESKGAGAIISNLLGAKLFDPIRKVLTASYFLHIIYFILLTVGVLLFSDRLFNLFNPGDGSIIADSMRSTFFFALIYMALFFLLDGFVWILIGFLTAAGDTRYLLLVSIAVNWIAYILPTYWFVGVQRGDAATAWAVIAGMNLVNFAIYLQRYRSGRWLDCFLGQQKQA